jgi:[ribosomal protein S5]-alanine N-acetyltransferase
LGYLLSLQKVIIGLLSELIKKQIVNANALNSDEESCGALIHKYKSKFCKMIETHRLIVQPLTYNQLYKHLYSPEELGAELQIIPSFTEMDEVAREAKMIDFLPYIQDPDRDYRFYTMWIVIEKCSRRLVGNVCFHGEADVDDEIEIGYSTEKDFRNQGIMTETIGGLIQWLKIHNIAKVLKAEIDVENISSIKVLEKNNFNITQKKDTTLILKLML